MRILWFTESYAFLRSKRASMEFVLSLFLSYSSCSSFNKWTSQPIVGVKPIWCFDISLNSWFLHLCRSICSRILTNTELTVIGLRLEMDAGLFLFFMKRMSLPTKWWESAPLIISFLKYLKHASSVFPSRANLWKAF